MAEPASRRTAPAPSIAPQPAAEAPAPQPTVPTTAAVATDVPSTDVPSVPATDVPSTPATEVPSTPPADLPEIVMAPADDEPAPAPAHKWKKARAQAAAKSSPKASRGGDAMLRVNTYEAVYARVSAGGQSIDVPGTEKLRLSAGTHVVKLVNKYLGITRTCSVKLEAGKVRTLKVSMEEGGCEVY
jgi:hypothetical protein